MSIIRQDRQQAKAIVVHFGDQLNVYLREELQIFEDYDRMIRIILLTTISCTHLDIVHSSQYV